MTAFHFAITRLDTGQLVGHALVCRAHYYLTVRWAGATDLERPIITAAAWETIDYDLVLGWEKGLVAATSATAKAVAGRRRADVQLQLVSQPPISERPGANVIGAFDDYLRAQVLP